MKILPFPLFFCCLFFDLSNGQTCTSPVYSNSGVTIKGPCPSSQVIAPVGSTVQLECSYIHSGIYLSFWNITGIEPIINENSLNSSIIVTTHGGSIGYTILILPVTKQDTLDVQCGLCRFSDCENFSVQPTVVSLPVQVISFGK